MRILKFNENVSISREDLTKDDISYILQIFDDAINLCSIKNLEIGIPWRNGGGGQSICCLELYNLHLDDGTLFAYSPTESEQFLNACNGIYLLFDWDIHTTGYKVNDRDTEKNLVDGNSNFIDVLEEAVIGIQRMKQDSKWGLYYEVSGTGIQIYLFKK